MGNGFAETSVHKVDQKKFEENFKKIKWVNVDIDLPKELPPGEVRYVPAKTPKLTSDELFEIYTGVTNGISWDELYKKYVGE